MSALLDPLSFLVAGDPGWLNEHQQHAIEYLTEEPRPARTKCRPPTSLHRKFSVVDSRLTSFPSGNFLYFGIDLKIEPK
jgi:hypothetical protein